MIDYKKLKSGICVKEGAHRSWRPPVSTFLNRGGYLPLLLLSSISTRKLSHANLGVARTW